MLPGILFRHNGTYALVSETVSGYVAGMQHNWYFLGYCSDIWVHLLPVSSHFFAISMPSKLSCVQLRRCASGSSG